jgi:hypothetical protein
MRSPLCEVYPPWDIGVIVFSAHGELRGGRFSVPRRWPSALPFI